MEDMTPAELRLPLVEAMLPHVAFDGWTWAALDAAADELRVPRARARLAFSGPIDMADAFTQLADETMAAALASEGVEAMKIRQRITRAVEVRLEQAMPHKEAVRRALAQLSLDPPRAARGLWRTVDAMWRAAGDTATDFNFYTKRAILAGVYSSTLLVWLADDSEDMAATRAFLKRRIDGVMRFEKTKAQAMGLRDRLPDPVRFLGRLRYPTAQ
jgi:ubiquinone biosynthesis protein COQ9